MNNNYYVYQKQPTEEWYKETGAKLRKELIRGKIEAMKARRAIKDIELYG